jgi:uncharacterized peroxidase-related enzyme
MSWIKIISYNESKDKLRKLYNRIKGPNNYIDNIMLAHSLRPNTLEGHMAIYKNVLHHSNNTFPKWFLEAIGVYTSALNNCDYCVNHHAEGMRKALEKDSDAAHIKICLKQDNPQGCFSGNELIILEYARKLTITPSSIIKRDVEKLKTAGISEGEILEVNQVVSYFCYANRTVLGLGVNIDNEIIGLSPSDESDGSNWEHS